VRYAFIEDHRDSFPVTTMCEVLGVSKSGFHSWIKRDHDKKARRRAMLVAAIREIYDEGRGTYGSPRILRGLQKRGIKCCKDTLEKLMRTLGIRAKTKKKFKVTTDSNHNLPVAPNLVGRAFDATATAPNTLWLADITYIQTDEGWLYLAAILDAHTRKIVGWSMDERMTKKLVLDALEMAYKRQNPGCGLVHHSDRGSQYASAAYQRRLLSYQMIASMSRKGDCWDNAPMESFFHTLKTEHVFFEKFATRAQARRSIFEWIAVFYNRKRMHSSLGYETPECYERQAFAKCA